MKTLSPRTRKTWKQVFSLLFCVLLTIGCLALPASSAEPDEPGTDDPVAAAHDETPDESDEPDVREVTVYFHVDDSDPIVETLNNTDRPSFEMPDIPQKDGFRFMGWYTDETDDGELLEQISGEITINGIPESVTELHFYARWEAEPDPTDHPEPETATLTFNFGKYGTVKVTATVGGYPEVPGFPENEAWRGIGVLYWTDAHGRKVDPATTRVTGDATYTAKTGKSISALLNTDDHVAYIHGSDDGLLHPTDPITRAEAATMISRLLRTKNFPHAAKFTDVKGSDWYANEVGLVNTLGIATGYSDGSFKPNRNITRAEFVKMAAACGQLSTGSIPFTDVSANFWARPYIASAYVNGWISPSDKFRPNDSITREEAIKIINLMLGRTGDSSAVNKSGIRNFPDAFSDRWSYSYIVEASTTHKHETAGNGKEVWTSHTQYTSNVKTGWLKSGNKTYYIGSNGKCLRGERTISGEKYIFDKNSGAASSGFFMVNGWKRYYKNGKMLDDISNLGVVSGPYYIKVYKPSNYVIVFAKGSDGKYNIPVKAMIASCGNPTPTGEFYTPSKYRWLQMVGGSWAQWCTQIQGDYLFHSVPNNVQSNNTMWSNEYNNLGTTRSLGCIRLTCADAKWVYDNCSLGTRITISPTETSGPLKKPTAAKIPSWHTWDPTDPTATYLCKQRGCH